MDMLPSSFQRELADATAEFCQQQAPLIAIRRRRDDTTPVESETWLAGAELGFIGLSVPEYVGGHGQRLDDHAMVFRELGRSLLPGPLVATVVATQLAAVAGSNDLAQEFIAGEQRAGFILPRGPEVSEDRMSGQLTLLDAAEADWALACDESGAGLVRTSDLASLTAVSCVDPGSRIANAIADGAPVHCWNTEPAPFLRTGMTLAAAQLVGMAEAALAMTVEYAKTRVQFGEPIGVNQAVKHSCAEMAVAAEAALQQTMFAAISLAEDRHDADFHCRAAKFLAGRAAIDNAGAGIQLHGGMGFTYEHDMHLFLSRAHVLDLILGRGREQLPVILELAAVD